MFVFPKLSQNIQIVFAWSGNRQDKNLRKQLESHISNLKHLGVSIRWLKCSNDAHQHLENDYYQYLEIASIIVLLVSPDLLHVIDTQPGLYNKFIGAIQRQEQEKVTVIPLLLRQVYGWEKILANLSALPKNGTPIASCQQRDEVFAEISKEIEEIVELHKQYERNLQEYQHQFYTIIENEYPFSTETLEQLNNLKINFYFKNKDIEEIETELRSEAEKKYNQKVNRYRQEYLKTIGQHRILSEEDSGKLLAIKQSLNIRDEDIIRIEQEVNQQITSSFTQKLFQAKNHKNFKFAVFAVFLPIVIIFYQNTGSKDVKTLLNEGQNKFEKGDYQGAKENYTQAIEINPKSFQAYIQRGQANFFLEDDKAAIEDYNKAITIDPKNIKTYIRRGDAYFFSNNFKAAIKDYNKALTIDSKNIYALLGRAKTSYYQKNYQAAIDDFTKVIGLAPNKIKAEAYMNRAVVRGDLKDIQGAIKDNQNAAIIYKKIGASQERKQALDRIKMLKKN